MNRNVYEFIIDITKRNTTTSKLELFESINQALILNKYPIISYETFSSITSNLRRRQIFKSSTNQWKKLKDNSTHISQNYSDLSYSSGLDDNNILKISNQLNLLSPVLTSRLILDGIIRNDKLSLIENLDFVGKDKASISTLVKETYVLKNERFAYEILESCFNDDDYGPTIDLIKNLVGFEHELKLEKILKDFGINFVKEKELREKGFDKTPDFKLDVPISLSDGTLISWIDSKATFGDEQSHKEYYECQFKYYLNRFGSGLVIYWFGYLNDIKNLYFNYNNSLEKYSYSLNKSIISISISDRFPFDFSQLDLNNID